MKLTTTPKANPVSVLLVFDTRSKKLLRSFEARGVNGRNHFNHVVVDGNGVAYVSNTLKSSIYSVDTSDENGTLKKLVEHEDLSWVHGIDLSPDGAKLFSTSYHGGVKFLDLKTKTFSTYRDTTLAGDDGLKYHEGLLYGVGQNTLKRYTLDRAQTSIIKVDTLTKDHPYFNDPRCLHIENGFLYCLANIEFEPVTFRGRQQPVRKSRLDDTYLLKFSLNQGR